MSVLFTLISIFPNVAFAHADALIDSIEVIRAEGQTTALETTFGLVWQVETDKHKTQQGGGDWRLAPIRGAHNCFCFLFLFLFVFLLPAVRTFRNHQESQKALKN